MPRYRLDIEFDGDHVTTPTRFDLERIILEALLERYIEPKVPWLPAEMQEAMVRICCFEGPCNP